MKVVIFAGGLGSRITEESHLKPKPMIELGDKPILWHIMKSYGHYGFNDFIICLGYKGYVIKEYFMHYFMHNSDISIELKNNQVDVHASNTESFKVTLVDTGLHTKTAGRLKRVRKYIGDEDFMLTYGDGLTDMNLASLAEFHKSHGKIATITAVQPEGKFGGMQIDSQNVITEFQEKPKGDGRWINAGFFVLKPEVFNYLDDNADIQMWEDEPMNNLTRDRQLVAYKYGGFWKCMDAMRDKIELENIWNSNKAKWKKWD
ncbi:MAG: glucose-1-phosphate cytidylyltransferase [Bacteroidetes bacterium]|nr:MAG: glucose-1-phosphate cytidylyltransferase [Bacteroidota bacterium]REJ99721.1 MAG: glucose-1-phosphate cytidylyltransferase [Bacteroidota bacterium]REK32915.1 MAG: glucose-1-phosphate cytidylyltransferase [Bacteroidota bacterium]REK47720.1 MAG: glucose-1-phosphate cytidylyltransferase [Bacteroidota bacterium]